MRAGLPYLFLLVGLLAATAALATPSVQLVWSDTTGLGTTGGSSIEAAAGDTLTLDMIVIPDVNGVQGAHVSLLLSSGSGQIETYYRPEFDFIYDGLGGMSFPFAAATISGAQVGAYVPGSAVTCPGPPALGNLATGFCGENFHTVFGDPTDFGGGVVGSFSALSLGAANFFPYTLGRLSLTVIPEPGTAALLATGLIGLAMRQRRRHKPTG